ncbi:unnamed protein product [Didymodactylos carnosus]|uniref:Pentapeptide repeat-containing protein n=1 Tax=Didymodactylos carnosus TaxID=1234261 RepID=A0A814XQW2_9BILA|nr:unnamed protein product [Didymodactylos carnosus]CAF3982703.1 unnamed protein product [Didymodactylos carnosus]
MSELLMKKLRQQSTQTESHCDIYAQKSPRTLCGITFEKWLKYSIALLVPLTIGILTTVITVQQNYASEHNRLNDLAIANKQREQDANISAQERQQADELKMDTLLASYIREIGELFLLEYQNFADEYKYGRLLFARAKTLLILRQVDVKRRQYVIQFLYETGLFSNRNDTIDLKNANLSGISFSKFNYDWTDVRLTYVCLTDSSFEGINLTGVNFTGSILTNANFRDTILKRSVFMNTILTKTDFTRSKLINITFTNADFTDAIFIETHVTTCSFARSTFVRADLSFMKLAYLNLFEETTSIRNTNFTKAKLIQADLLNADFRDSTLIGTDLQASKLQRTNFIGSDLSEANLFGVKEVYGAIFDNVNLTNAILPAVQMLLTNAILPNGSYVYKSFDFGMTDMFNSSNIILNGDAEWDRCINDTEIITKKLPSKWLKSYSALTVYQFPSVIQCSKIISTHDGCCFWGGKSDRLRLSANQLVSTSNYSRLIDSHRARMLLSALMGGVKNESDYIYIQSEFYDGRSVNLGESFYVEEPYNKRINRTGLLSFISSTQLIPRFTRQIRISLWFLKKSDGPYSGGIVDDIELIILPVNNVTGDQRLL